MKKAALYARVSTLDQHPENQVEALQKYALDNDFSIYKEYVDMISGAKKSRPALNDLMNDMRAGKFKTVLIWKLDRLGRSLQHLLQVVEEMNINKVDLVTITQGFMDTSGPSGKLIFQIFGAMSEFERGLIQERVKLAAQRAKKEGRPWGRPPGTKDKSRRRKSGYYNRWSDDNERKRRSKSQKEIWKDRG